MSIWKVAAMAMFAAMLTAPVVGHASEPGNSFDNFGHSVVHGAKQAGHAVENGAKDVGHSIVSGWHSVRQRFDDR